MKKKYYVLIALLLTILFIKPLMEWDEYVYLLNAETFSGNQIYFEEQRPPLFPLILTLFNGFLWIAPIILFMINIIFFYKFSEKFRPSPEKSVLVLLCCPIYLMFSKKYMTSITGTTFILISLILLYSYHKKKKDLFLYTSFLSASFATLTRYPLGLIYPVLLVLFFIFCGKDYKKLFFSQIIFWTPIIVWIRIIGLQSIKNAIIWSVYESNPLTYIKYSPLIIGFNILLLPLIILNYEYKKKHLWFLIPLITILSFFQLLNNKWPRFLMPSLPFFSLLISYSLKKKDSVKILMIMFLITIFGVNTYISGFCRPDYKGVSEFFENKDAVILSNFWPICSYYSSNTCLTLSEDYSSLNNRITSLNSNYIMIMDFSSYPQYASNFTNFRHYDLEKIINNSCNEIRIYRVE